MWGLTHLRCIAVLDFKIYIYIVYTCHLLISGSFQRSIDKFSLLLLTSLLAGPVSGIAVERELQAPQITPRAHAALWTGLGAIQRWRELESWKLVEGSHSSHLGTRKLIIVANAPEQQKIQC